jgi:hypothetical protein
MNAEEVIFAYIKSEFLTSKKITFIPTNLYYELVKNKKDEVKENENNKESI